MMTSGTMPQGGGSVEQQPPSDMGRPIESAESHDERCEQLVAVAQRVMAGAIPDTNYDP